MMNTVASLALFAASAAAATGKYGYTATGVGSAHVINKCNYPVQLCNVPASGGGYEQEDKTLAAGESWSQPWTELTNGAGWSIKLSKTDSFQNNILQYEYQFSNEGIIWFDLSCVDGNPWDQDWELTANGTDCAPKQQAYRYSTDDAYGMQSCSQDTAITVTLCTGVSADNGSAVEESSSNSSASAPSYASAASAPSYEDKTSTSKAASTPAATAYGYNWNNADAAKSSAAMAHPTTFATAVTAVSTHDSNGVTITEIETIYETAAVTAYGRHRRHEHNHGAHKHE